MRPLQLCGYTKSAQNEAAGNADRLSWEKSAKGKRSRVVIGSFRRRDVSQNRRYAALTEVKARRKMQKSKKIAQDTPKIDLKSKSISRNSHAFSITPGISGPDTSKAGSEF
jgi:hypothetical protein